MAKEIEGYIKLQVKGGQANPAPPVGPAKKTLGKKIEKVTLHQESTRTN